MAMHIITIPDLNAVLCFKHCHHYIQVNSKFILTLCVFFNTTIAKMHTCISLLYGLHTFYVFKVCLHSISLKLRNASARDHHQKKRTKPFSIMIWLMLTMCKSYHTKKTEEWEWNRENFAETFTFTVQESICVTWQNIDVSYELNKKLLHITWIHCSHCPNALFMYVNTYFSCHKFATFINVTRISVFGVVQSIQCNINNSHFLHQYSTPEKKKLAREREIKKCFEIKQMKTPPSPIRAKKPLYKWLNFYNNDF